jgi:hypothetical protein
MSIDLHKRLFLLVTGEENSPQIFLTMDALFRLSQGASLCFAGRADIAVAIGMYGPYTGHS